jgi:8-oxo-dGTP diphosphatase
VKLPKAAFAIVKEAARHLLRRPVVGVCAFARARDGRVLLIRRGDTGEWALPGGTLEWGETLQSCVRRELLEEAGVEVTQLGGVLGVYSHPRPRLSLPRRHRNRRGERQYALPASEKSFGN